MTMTIRGVGATALALVTLLFSAGCRGNNECNEFGQGIDAEMAAHYAPGAWSVAAVNDRTGCKVRISMSPAAITRETPADLLTAASSAAEGVGRRAGPVTVVTSFEFEVRLE